MSSDPFRFFGLDRKTATASDIKKAYAVRLKTTRPDDDPAGFMALRASLEGALSQIKWRDQYPQPAYDDDDDDEVEDDTEDDEASTEDASPPPPTDQPPQSTPEVTTAPDAETEEPEPARAEPTKKDIELPSTTGAQFAEPDDPWAVDETDPHPSDELSDGTHTDQQPFTLTEEQILNAALEDLDDLMTSDQRTDWQSWLKILDRPAFDSLDMFQDLSSALRAIVCNKSGFQEDKPQPHIPPDIPADVIIQLDNRFGWSQQSGREWYERDLNTWIARLVKAAEWKSGTVSEAKRTQSFFRENSKFQLNSDQPQRKRRSKAFNIGWTVFRLFILYSVVRGIIALLADF